MAQALISALFDRWAGKPILVVCGGPSVLTDLPLPITPACVISANEHGMKQNHYPVDLIVNMDQKHALLGCNMEVHLRPYGVPIVNRYSWSDYRLAEWSFPANSGMSAVLIAAALGANPVIVTGIDGYSRGRDYFHDQESIKKRWKTLHVSRFTHRNLHKLADACKGANIRPLSGPMLDYFPRFDPKEALPPPKLTDYRVKLMKAGATTAVVTRKFALENHDVARPGAIIALTPKEARSPRIIGFATGK